MNAIAIVKTDTLEDLPSAIHQLANEVETQIRVLKEKANAIGGSPLPNGHYMNFDFSVTDGTITSLNEWFEDQINRWFASDIKTEEER